MAFDFDHMRNIHGSTNSSSVTIIQPDSDTSQGCLLIKVALTMWDDVLSGHKNGFSISCGGWALEKGAIFPLQLLVGNLKVYRERHGDF